MVATSNAGKLGEIQSLLRDLPVALVGLSDLQGIEPVPETGKTFTENASLKASGYATQARLLTLADDSGLEVDALDGGPGVFSARYLGESVSFRTRIESLLDGLAGTAPAGRRARFVSAVAIAGADGAILNISHGICEGRIAFEPRGSGGFGYDPVFLPSGYDLTFAELPIEVKNQISHRALAMRSARGFLEGLTGASGAG